MDKFTRFVLWALGKSHSPQRIADTIQLGPGLVEEEMAYLRRIGFLSDEGKPKGNGEAMFRLIDAIEEFNASARTVFYNRLSGKFEPPAAMVDPPEESRKLPIRHAWDPRDRSDRSCENYFRREHLEVFFGDFPKEMRDSIHCRCVWDAGCRDGYMELAAELSGDGQDSGEPADSGGIRVRLRYDVAVFRFRCEDPELSRYRHALESLGNLSLLDGELLSPKANDLLRREKAERDASVKAETMYDPFLGRTVDVLPCHLPEDERDVIVDLAPDRDLPDPESAFLRPLVPPKFRCRHAGIEHRKIERSLFLDSLARRTPEKSVQAGDFSGLRHCLLDMEPAARWHVYVGESGQSFSVDEPGSEGRMVAVCMPEGHLLPPVRMHGASEAPSDVREAFARLVESPCGIFGLSRDVLAIRGTDGWKQMLRQLVRWVWRLLPLPPEGEVVGLSVHAGQHREYSAAMGGETLRTMCDNLMADLTREDPERAGKMRLLAVDFVDGDDPRRGWADVVASCWGCRKEEIRQDLKASRLLDSCLVRLSPDGLSLCQDILEGMSLDMEGWTRLFSEHTKNLGNAGTSPLTVRALHVLADRCRKTPALLRTYTQAMNNYLLGREYELPVLETMAEWLSPFKSDDPVTRYFWCLARLAHLNHKGDPCSGELLSIKKELVGLLPEMGAKDPMAELEAALRLAVSDSNAFAFELAESRLARWNPDKGGTLTGTALWDGKILSSLGQYRAFQGDLAGACRLFGLALAEFGRMPREMGARQLTQTRNYLAIAAMDREDMDDATVCALVEDALDGSIRSSVEKALRAPLKDRYGHYLLVRYLSKRGSGEERALYLQGRKDWTKEGTGFTWGHPWPIIQYRRWLLADPGDADLRRGIADSLAACIGESRPTVALIVCAIARSMGFFEANNDFFPGILLDLESIMPGSGPIVQRLMAFSGHDDLLASRLLPFNYC